MSSRTNKIKTNKLKDKPKPKRERKKRVSSKKSRARTGKPIDPRVKRIFGFIFLVISIYLLLAIISFFVNWFEADIQDFKDHTEIVKNWTGSIGVWLSGHMVKVAGIGAFFLPLLFFSIGLKMMAGIRMFKLWIWFQIIVIGLLWLPLVLNKI